MVEQESWVQTWTKGFSHDSRVALTVLVIACTTGIFAGAIAAWYHNSTYQLMINQGYEESPVDEQGYRTVWKKIDSAKLPKAERSE